MAGLGAELRIAASGVLCCFVRGNNCDKDGMGLNVIAALRCAAQRAVVPAAIVFFGRPQSVLHDLASLESPQLTLYADEGELGSLREEC